MTNAQRDQRVEVAQVRVLFQVPFFAPAIARLPIVWDENVETACTNGKEIRWCPSWFDTLEDQHLVTLLCHEACHPLLGHLWRLPPPGGDPQLANIACDHAVNLMLKEFGALRMAGGFADPFPFPPGNYCCDEQYKGMAEEAIYARIASQQNGGSNGSTPSGKTRLRSNGAQKSGVGNRSGGNPSKFGEFETPKDDATSNKTLRSDWDGTLIQACKLAKGQGNLPGGMERFVGELVSPKVAWNEVLRSLLRETCSDDWNWQEPATEYEGSGFILPSLKSERMSSVVFCIDTSGSIDGPLLTQFKSEIQYCLDQLRSSKVIELCCDARITRETEYVAGDSVLPDAPGGGGTMFEPCIQRCAKMEPTPKAVVYLTDMQGSFGDAPDFPVIWINYGPTTEAPYGQTIQVE
jgi:predicted metal-dependent peptidase